MGFGGYSTTPYLFMCRGEVGGLDDLAGQKVRASGGGVNITEIAGATPVSMPPSEATSALERGTLDCVLGAVSWLRSYGYMDVLDTVIESPMGMGGPPVLMYVNRDVWEGLSPEMRAKHIELAPDLVVGASYDAQLQVDQEVMEEAKAQGVTFVDGGEDFAEVMDKRDQQQRDINLQNARDAGAKDPEAMIDFYLSAYDKWKQLLDEQGNDRDTFRRLLWEEVYSKVDPEDL